MEDKIKGCLYGLSIGDAIGLRYENVKPKDINENNIGKVCFGGAISDDTEHMILISKSILNTENIKDFENDFKNELKKWLISFPVNIGKTTLYSIIRSFFKSGYGIKGTGNGSVMRIAPVGLIFHKDHNKLVKYASSSCRITHNAEESIINSIAIAKLISEILNKNWDKNNKPEIDNVLKLLGSISKEEFWTNTINELKDAFDNDIEPIDLVYSWTKEKGALGYTKYSTLLSIYCWIKYYGDYEKTLKEIIKCGGDTDTNAAIVGALTGATIGYNEIPNELKNKINDLTVSRKDIDNLSKAIIENKNIIKTNKIHYLGMFKNVFSLFYFITLLTKVNILSLFKIKH